MSIADQNYMQIISVEVTDNDKFVDSSILYHSTCDLYHFMYKSIFDKDVLKIKELMTSQYSAY